jgi:hypothetical protein
MMRPRPGRWAELFGAIVWLVVVGVLTLVAMPRIQSPSTPRRVVEAPIVVDWTRPANRGLLARASTMLAYNRLQPWPESVAREMTVVNLAEANGYVDVIGPVRRDDQGLYVGNDNGTVDVSGWQLNGAVEGLTPPEYAKQAYSLWAKRQFRPWVAYKNRASNSNWILFTAIVDEAARLNTLPTRWAEAAKRRRTVPTT